MDNYIIFAIGRFLLWPVIIIGLIIFFVRRRKKGAHPANDKEWYLQFALSKEDAVSQLFILLSVFFLGVTLLAFNGDLGDPLSWRTILFITSIIGLAMAYYLKALYTLAFGLIGVTAWWGAQAAEWIHGRNIKASVIITGLAFMALLFYTLGHLHEKDMKWKRFALVYSVIGIIFITGALFIFSAKPGLTVFETLTKGLSFFDSWPIILSLFIFLAALAGVSFYALGKKLLSPFESFAVLLLALLFGAIALLPPQDLFVPLGNSYNFYSGGRELSSSGILWALIFNFVLFFQLLGLVFSGYLRQETWLINLGAFFLFLLIIVKYFDWFFTFLDKSIFFIGAGILLFVVGWLMERGRKYMISDIKAQSQKIPQ